MPDTSSIQRKTHWNAIAITAILGILCTTVGFLTNRVVCNIGFLLMGLVAIMGLKTTAWLWKNTWMWSFIGLALLPILSDMWYEGIGFYQQKGMMKLLFVLFPFFLFSNPLPRDYFIKIVHWVWIAAILCSTCYSILILIGNADQIINDYNVSKVLQVLSYGDHIRISWVTVITCLFAAYQITKTRSSISRLLLAGYILGQVVFLHILGSKSGLVILYLTLAIGIVYLSGQKKKWFLLAMPLILVLPIIAYVTIPSFQKRVKYIRYDFEHYSVGDYRDGLSDALRVLSLQAGRDMVKEKPIFGVGFSNLQEESEAWYKEHHPNVRKESYFMPISQILLYWAGGGILGILLVIYHIGWPLFHTIRKNIWFIAFFVPATISLTYENHWEGQLPLFVYGFFVSWFWYLAEDNKVDYTRVKEI